MSETTPTDSSVKPPIPEIYASVMHYRWTSNEWTITFKRTPSNFDPSQPIPEDRYEPVAVVRMSPQAAKDLYLLLQDGVQKYEKQFGSITTAYSQNKDQAQ